MADYSYNNDASQDERKEVLENDRRAVYLVQNIRRNFRSVSRFSEYHGGVLRPRRLTRSFCPRMVSIMPKV